MGNEREPSQESQFKPTARQQEAQKLLERRTAATGSETCRLNRLLLESALAPTLKSSPCPWPLFPDEFQHLLIIFGERARVAGCIGAALDLVD